MPALFLLSGQAIQGCCVEHGAPFALAQVPGLGPTGAHDVEEHISRGATPRPCFHSVLTEYPAMEQKSPVSPSQASLSKAGHNDRIVSLVTGM